MVKEQLEVLKALDIAKTQLYHFTVIVIAGSMGFFTDAYDLFCISLACQIVAIIISAIFDKQFPAPAYAADYIWRIIVIFGAILAALTYYWRMKMPETARYTALVEKNAERAAADMSKVLNKEIKAETEMVLSTVKNCSKDIFTAIGWIPPSQTMSASEEVFKIARAQTLIALCSTVPGYWFTVAFIDIMGRWAIQMMCFFFMTVFMFAIAFPYNYRSKKENRIGFVIMYALTLDLIVQPSLSQLRYSKLARLRSTCHGISAAARKAGAIIGAFGFLYAAQNQDPKKTDHGYPAVIGVKNSLMVLGVINFIGMLFTFLVPEPNGRSLEELERRGCG
ncbi:hypothetical protein MKW94_007042 [Papaver nudicaule]|uniref:Uncharacterized protein n=1 Tax=Papaver nudicaule TaxID=74823 RepID=A0AA41VF79_PAPNU|nr:hypothetical protein [Papaver nudicaule]